MSAPRAETLFHFTKSLDIVLQILQNGFIPRFCLEDIEWMQMNNRHLAFAMSSFCDIPLSRITEHTSFYGQYGLGLTKEWGLRNGLNPVVYFPPSGHIPKLASFLMDFNAPDEHMTAMNAHVACLIKLMKPIRGQMVISGAVVEKDFYQESEWRYTPELDSFIELNDFEKNRDAGNKRAEAFAIKFLPSDVRYIFVPTDADIPPLSDFIHNRMGNYPHNDIKILQTRIMSLKAIEADI